MIRKKTAVPPHAPSRSFSLAPRTDHRLNCGLEAASPPVVRLTLRSLSGGAHDTVLTMPATLATPDASPDASADSGADSGADVSDPRRAQAALDALLDPERRGPELALRYSYPMLIKYLAGEGASSPLDEKFAVTLRDVASRILAAGGGEAVYLADERAYTAEALRAEFPELRLFRLSPAEAFVESCVRPGLWLETQRFVDLRSLSRMRRELKRTGLADGIKAARAVQVLLGLDSL